MSHPVNRILFTFKIAKKNLVTLVEFHFTSTNKWQAQVRQLEIRDAVKTFTFPLICPYWKSLNHIAGGLSPTYDDN